jgi:hypothetical protein
MKVQVTIAGRGNGVCPFDPTIELPTGSSVAAAIESAQRQLGDRRLADSTLVFIGQTHLGTIGRHDDAPLVDGAEILLLRPVAGG